MAASGPASRARTKQDQEGSARSPLASLQGILQEESEHQWAAMGAYGVVVLIVAALLHIAPSVGGVVDRPMLDAGESVADFAWSADGKKALIIVERGNVRSLELLDGGSRNAVLTPSYPSSVQAMSDGWIVGCEGGQIGVVQGTGFTESALTWAGSAPTVIVDVASTDGTEGWVIAGATESSARLHRCGSGTTSLGASIPADDVRLKSVHADASGSSALLLGVTTAFGNPLLGASGEVVIHASAVGVATPDLTLLHHASGAPLSSVHTIDGVEELRAWVVGPSSTLLVRSDMTVAEMGDVGGADASAIGGDGDLWLFDDGGSIRLVDAATLTSQDRRYSPSVDDVVGAVSAHGGAIDVFHGDDQTRRVSIDASGEGGGSSDVSRLMDAGFLLITLVIMGVLIRNFWEGGFDAW